MIYMAMSSGGDTSYTNVEVEDQAVKDPSRLHDPAKLQAWLAALPFGQHVLQDGATRL